MARSARALAITILMVLAGVAAARAQSLFEKLISPGEVIEGHAKFEKTCESCHAPFAKQSQRGLCLECHKDVASDIAAKHGFHGKRTDAATAECKTCHTDHKGRKADIIQFDAETFNHTSTDFDLHGAHKTTPCASCHVSGKKFRDAPQACVSCHKTNDVHKGALGEGCAACHSEESWKTQKAFDHSKTNFALKGAHRDVQCAACHAGERYKGVPHACADCHKAQDVHDGRFGQKCETCHGETKWKTVSFDHAKMTKFPLGGAHATVKCETCHTGGLYTQKLGSQCVACHKKDDPHKGELGPRCENCHNDTSWRKKVTFDHDLTRFPLIGLHAAVPCEQCHRDTAYRETPKTCSECHKDQHHEGKLGNACARCHNPNGWALWRFNHDTETKFALTGAHIGLQCHACHSTPASTKVTAPTTCYGCHASDDAHRGTFGRTCEKCHTTTSFRDGVTPR